MEKITESVKGKSKEPLKKKLKKFFKKKKADAEDPGDHEYRD